MLCEAMPNSQKQAIEQLKAVLEVLREEGHASHRVLMGAQDLDLDDPGVGELSRSLYPRLLRATDPAGDHSELLADAKAVISKLDKVSGGVINSG